MLDTLTHFVASYGYLAVGVIILVECAGIPLPGETALLVAAAYAGAGHLQIGIVVLVAAAAAILGDNAGYWVGRQGGRALLERYGKRVRLDASRLAQLETFFARHGAGAVFWGRFIGVLRTYAALFAGVSRMRYSIFAVYNALGGITWAVVFGLLGYFFGQNLHLVEQIVGTLGWALLGSLGLVVLAGLVWRWAATHHALLLRQRDRLFATPVIARLRVRYHRQLVWFRHRLTPGQYLGLHVTIGLTIAILGLGLFGGLAEDVKHNDPIVHFDQTVATTLHNTATPAATTTFATITQLGGPVLVVLGVVVAGLYAWRRQWLHLGTWIVALGGDETLNVVLKHLVARPRPVFALPLGEQDYSFPSGHAMGSLVVYGILAYFAVLVLRSWRARSGVMCGAVLLVLLIGFSRLYLGVHYFSDVIGGYAAGSVWLSTCITGMELVRRGELSERWQQRLQRWTKRYVRA